LRKGWHEMGFDSSKWRILNAPEKWESQGITQFNQYWKGQQVEPYDGFAWYRRGVVIPDDWKGKRIYLNAGRIDDADVTYINGALIGRTGTATQIAPQVYRVYEIPSEVVRFGKPNVIAIRVLDMHGDGGIMSGPISLTLSAPEAEGREPANTPLPTTYNYNDRVNVGGNVIIEQDEGVNGATAVLGNVDISGHVQRDATAVGGNVIIRKTGRVDGSVTAVGGNVVREPGSQVGGAVTSIGGFGGWLATPFMHGRWFDGLISVWGFVMSLLFGLAAVFLAAIIPDRIEMIASTAFSRPGWSALYGVIATFLIVPIGLFLLLTVFGIPLLPLWALIVMAAFFVGGTGAKAAVGLKIGEAVGRPIASVVLATFFGGLVIAAVKLVPVAGALLLLILNLLGFGAVWITMFGTHPDWFANRTRKSSPGGTEPPPAAP
jgi:hypothetical protein